MISHHRVLISIPSLHQKEVSNNNCRQELSSLGHLGIKHCVLYRVVVLSSVVKIGLGRQSVSFIARPFLLCPLFGETIIRGATVIPF